MAEEAESYRDKTPPIRERLLSAVETFDVSWELGLTARHYCATSS